MYFNNDLTFWILFISDPIGCPRNEGGWYELEKGSNILFRLIITILKI